MSMYRGRISGFDSARTTCSSSGEVTVIKTMKPRRQRSQAIERAIGSCGELAITEDYQNAVRSAMIVVRPTDNLFSRAISSFPSLSLLRVVYPPLSIYEEAPRPHKGDKRCSPCPMCEHPLLCLL